MLCDSVFSVQNFSFRKIHDYSTCVFFCNQMFFSLYFLFAYLVFLSYQDAIFEPLYHKSLCTCENKSLFNGCIQSHRCRQFAQFKFIFAYKQWFTSLFNSFFDYTQIVVKWNVLLLVLTLPSNERCIQSYLNKVMQSRAKLAKEGIGGASLYSKTALHLLHAVMSNFVWTTSNGKQEQSEREIDMKSPFQNFLMIVSAVITCTFWCRVCFETISKTKCYAQPNPPCARSQFLSFSLCVFFSLSQFLSVFCCSSVDFNFYFGS